MKRFVLLVLLLSLAGCGALNGSAAGQSPALMSSSSPEQSRAATFSPTLPLPAATSLSPAPPAVSPAATAPPPVAFSTPGSTAVATQETSSSAMVGTPSMSAPTGWKTFTSANWHVAMDYPPEWTVNAQSMSVTFTSQQGAAIALTLVDGGSSPTQGSLDDMPNTRCSSQTNSHDVTARVCLDTIAFSYTADFVVKWPGREAMLTLSMGRRGDFGVFNAMIASLRTVS
jgi:hypothetical protein